MTGFSVTAEAGDPLRLTILGGYLGAGKTTWLRHALHEGRFGRTHAIVNEAAEIPVDDAFLKATGDVTVLAGGCVCCTGRAELIAALRRVCDARSRLGAARLDHVVLETSGLADPSPIAAAIKADPVLARHIRLEQIVVLVDAQHGAVQLASDRLGRNQIEAADRLVMTKAEEAPDLDRLRATLARLNPAARISAASHGVAIPLAPLRAGTPPLPLGPAEAMPPPTPVPVTLPNGLAWSSFAVWLSALLHARGDRIVRVKGVVRSPAGRLLLQGVRRTVQSPEILPGPDAPTDDTIILIGRDIDPIRVMRSLDRLM